MATRGIKEGDNAANEESSSKEKGILNQGCDVDYA